YTLTTPFSLNNISLEHDGDVLLDDTGSSLTVTQIAVTGESNTAVSSGSSYNSSGTSKTGTYGTLRIGADGSYDYVADQSVTDNLDAGDIVTDSFTYTVSNGSGSDTATLIITVVGVNDTPVADNETGSVNASQTLTVTDGSSDLLDGDTDADTSASLSVSSIVATTASGSATAVNPGTAYNSGYTSVTGSYGTLRIGADGTYQYIAGSSAGTDVFTYTLFDGTATDTATLTITVNAVPVARNDTGNINEGATLTVSDGDNETSVATATFSSANSYSSTYPSNSSDVIFNDDGTKMYVSDSNSGYIYQYNISTAFDVSSASYLNNYASGVAVQSMSFNNDGTKWFLLTTSQIREYSISTGFDTSSSNVSVTTSSSLSSQDSTMTGVAFNNDGTKMFTVGAQYDKVYEYALSTAFDISTLSYTDSLSISSQETSPTDIRFNLDGTKMYITGTAGQDINEYTLSTAFDISSTVTHKGSYSLSSSDAYPTGFSFNNDGTKLFTTGATYDRVNEHSLTSPFSLVDVSGEHSGDVINTSNTDTYDTDADGDTLTVTTYSHTSATNESGGSASSGNGNSGTAGSDAVIGYYGTLTLAANGSYTYAPTLIVPVSLRAVRSWLGITYIVNVFVLVPLPVSSM
ncbi:Ig-like domain-containing protein, partial [Candidatus Pelagibacter sp.]|nr:Ig-like domain-containing protein [Candidatus Pelagibacter sp.]